MAVSVAVACAAEPVTWSSDGVDDPQAPAASTSNPAAPLVCTHLLPAGPDANDPAIVPVGARLAFIADKKIAPPFKVILKACAVASAAKASWLAVIVMFDAVPSVAA